MKKPATALMFASIFLSLTAKADVKSVEPGSKEEEVANTASQISFVTNLKIGTWAFQIVSMDSELNGDTSMSTIVLVGDKGVGGEAGFDAAFVLTPTADLRNLKSVRVLGGKLAFSFYTQDSKVVNKLYTYDAASKTLKESGK